MEVLETSEGRIRTIAWSLDKNFEDVEQVDDLDLKLRFSFNTYEYSRK